MSKKRVPVQALRVMLIREGVEYEEELFGNKHEVLKRYELKKSSGLSGYLYVRPQTERDPVWVTYIQPHLSENLGKLKNQSTSAVLFIEHADRLFAFTYGYGRSLLDPHCYERDFGLKVVLNRVDPDSLRSIDYRKFEEMTLQTRRNTSRDSRLDAFGINVTEDIVRAVTGLPSEQYQNFARRMAGSDALHLSLQIEFKHLGAKCEELLEAYQSDEYKARFEFIDHIRPVRAPDKIEELDELLLEAMRSEDTDGMHMAPPESVDWQSIEGFTFAANDDELCEDLQVNEFLATLDDPATLALEEFKKCRVWVKYAETLTPLKKWSVRECIVFEQKHNGVLYAFSCGDWYEIEENFVSRVNRKVKALAKDAMSLPVSEEGEDEEIYNARAAKAKKYALVDRKCPYIGGSPVEPCDLLTDKGQFIHVKKRGSSSTLSHLFSQGTVGADCFISEPTFREKLRKIVSGHPKVAALVPDDRPNPQDYEIVYAIIDDSTRTWPLSLPFFSRLNLMNAANHLERMMFKVSLARIEISE